MRSNRIFIERRKGLKSVDWRELVDYRDLFFFIVWRNVKVRYAQSMLGLGWAIIQPFFTMIVFTIVFGRLANIASDGAPYAVFSFAALVPWTYFANSVTESTNSLVAEAGVISKVYFPRLILPFAAVLAKLVDFTISFLFLLVLLLFFQVKPNLGVFVLPLLIFIMMMTAAGIGLWLTALAIQYRDVKYAVGFIVQILMYASPVVYPTSLVPESYQWLYALNPMVGVIEGFRSALLGTISMPWLFIFLGSLVSLVLAITGILYFKFKEQIFADVA